MSRAALLDDFASFPDRLATAARAAEGRPVPDGEWSPAEVVRHLIAVEDEVWTVRFGQLAAGDHPTWAWTEPGPAAGLDGVPLDGLLAAFATARSATAATLGSFDDAGWARFGTHATYGVLDVAGLLRLAADHDGEHLAGLAGSGAP